MKAILLTAGLLLAAPAAFAQQPQAAASYPLKQANVVVARTPDSLQVAYGKLTKALLAAGYGLEKSDKQNGFILTTPVSTKARPAVYATMRFTLLQEQGGTTIEARGDYTVSGLLGSTPIINKGQQGSASAAAWAELQKAAALYPGGIVAYRIQR